MKFDDILVHLGEFGFYQKRLYFILCVPVISVAFHALENIFAAGLPEHRCAIPGLDNDSYTAKDSHHQWLINRNIPLDGSDYSKCQIYDLTTNGSDEALLIHTNQSRISCDRWVYDKSVFETTLTEMMSLVCTQLIRRSHLNMLGAGGSLVGTAVLGALADIFGRKKILYISLIAQLAVGMFSVWVPEYYSLCVARFLQGIIGSGIFSNAFIMGIELVAPSKRMWPGMLIEVVWVIGEFLVVGVAYLIRDWHYFTLAISIPSVLYIAIWWLVPESPRWLLANGRPIEAEKILQRAAEVSKVNLPEGIFEEKIEHEEDDGNLPKVKLWQLFTHRTLFIRSVVIFYNWFVVSLMYYGLTLNSAYLYGGIYLNLFLSVVVELIGYALCFPLLDRIGRRVLHASSMLVGGIACLCTIFTVLYLPEEYQLLTTALALVGKLGASAAFAIIYIYSAELYPTVIRSGSMGLSSMFARVGGMLAAYIADLGKLFPGTFGTVLPLIVFGVVSVVAGLVSLSLPETLNRKLPETIEDAIKFRKQESLSPSISQNGSVTGISLKKIDGHDNPAICLENP